MIGFRKWLDINEWKKEAEFFKEKDNFRKELPTARDQSDFESWIANKIDKHKRLMYGTADETPEERKQRHARIRELIPQFRAEKSFFYGITGVKQAEKEDIIYQICPGVYSNMAQVGKDFKKTFLANRDDGESEYDNIKLGGESKLPRELWFDANRVWLLQGLHLYAFPKLKDFKPIVWAEKQKFRNHNLLSSPDDIKDWQKCLKPLQLLINCKLLCEKCHISFKPKDQDEQNPNVIFGVISLGDFLNARYEKIEFLSFDEIFGGLDNDYDHRRLNRQLSGLKYTPDEIRRAREKDIYAFRYGEQKY